MLWPYQKPLRRYRVTGVRVETGRKRTKAYEAMDEKLLAEVAKADGTAIESIEEIEPIQPSDRQLAYAESLGITRIPEGSSRYDVSNMISEKIKTGLVDGARKAGLSVPDNISYEEGKDLENLLVNEESYGEEEVRWSHLDLPNPDEVALATALGVNDLTRYTSAPSLYSKIWDALYSATDKTKLAAWYIFNVFLDIRGGDWEEAPHPMDARFQQLASEFLKDDRASKSLDRATPYLRFRERAGGRNNHTHASRKTIAYDVAASLVEREFLIRRTPSAQAVPRKTRKTAATEVNTGCAGVVALLFVIPLSAAAGLIYVAATHL